LKVNHVKEFKIPKEYLELDEDENIDTKIYKPTGPDGRGWGQFRK